MRTFSSVTLAADVYAFLLFTMKIDFWIGFSYSLCAIL